MKIHVILGFAILGLLFASCNSSSENNDGIYDEEAVESLDRLSEAIGQLNSCSYTLNTLVRELDVDDEYVEYNNTHDVYMRGPNKMHIYTIGSKGEKSYWYNGSTLSFYSYDKNIYDTVSAPATIIPAIDFLHNKYGIDFPASNFFYPDFTDDILNNFNNVFYLGEVIIDDIECIAIEATNNDNILSIWFNKESALPYKMILEKNEENAGFYEATLSNWRINPTLPDLLFEFEPPAGATRMKIEPIN